MKTVGIEEKSGVYEGTPYHNVIFHCNEPFENGKGIGTKTDSIKVKARVLSENFGKSFTEKELTSFIGK